MTAATPDTTNRPVAPALTPAARALFYAYDQDAPLAAETSALPASPASSARQPHTPTNAVHQERLHFDSTHGERVAALLWLPKTARPAPLVLMQHGGRRSKEDRAVTVPAARWARQGCAVLALDAHGHGERSRRAGEPWRRPWARRDHAVQMAVDLMRALDYAATRPELDRGRVVFVGYSMGAHYGLPFVALDPRVRAAAFCLTGTRQYAAAEQHWPRTEADRAVEAIIDPIHFAPLLAGRPTLLINGDRDPLVPPASARALFDALPEPKEQYWFAGGHDLTPAAFKRLHAFVAEHTTAGC